MEDAEWKEFVESLVEAKRCLASAWAVLDGTDGAAAGSEEALTSALASIDALYAIESDNDADQDVAAPTEVQRFWAEHQQLPGFAVGS